MSNSNNREGFYKARPKRSRDPERIVIVREAMQLDTDKRGYAVFENGSIGLGLEFF